MEQTEQFFPFNLIILGKIAVYFFSLSIGLFVFSTRNPTKKTDVSRRDSTSATLALSTASEGDSPRSCATVPEAKHTSQLHTPSSPTADFLPVRISSLPFTGPRASTEAGMVVDRSSSNLIIHGGGGTKGTLLGDLHIFDCEKLSWHGFDFTPNDRHQFSIISTHDGRVVVFGGIDKQGRTSNALSTIDLSPPGFAWSDHHIQSIWPVARYGQAMCLIDDTSIAMYGGQDGEGNRLNDLWLLNTNAFKWKETKPNSSLRPKLRSKPSTAHLNGKIYLFGRTSKSRGEIDCFNLRTHKWERSISCGEEPRLQDCQVHALEKAGKLVTVSNSEPSACRMFNRLDILDATTKPMTWASVDLSWYGDWSMLPGCRRRFCSAIDPEKGLLYVFGGVQASAQPAEGEEEDLLSTLIVANFSRHNIFSTEI